MAANPLQKRRRGLFGAPAAPTPHMPPERQPQPQMAQPQGKTGFFAQGGPGRAIAGAIGDFLLQYNDMAPIYAPQMQQQQAIAAQQAAEQRKRAADLAGWRWKQDYQRENPGGTALQQNYEWLRQNHPDAADAYLERMTSNYEYRQGPDGRFYRIDIAEQPARPVGGLKPMGGTGGNAGGGF